jgi:hypothetical protein
MSPPPEEIDLYNETRRYPLAYDSTVDPVVVREMELMTAEAKAEALKNVSEDSDVGSDVEEVVSDQSTSEDSSDSESEEVEDNEEWEDVGEALKTNKGKKKAKKPKVFTPVDKV